MTRSTAQTRWRQDKARYGRIGFLFDPTLVVIAVYRCGQYVDESLSGTQRIVATKVYWFAHHVISTIFGIELPKEARIGGGLRMYHSGGIVIHPNVVMGKNVTLRHGVTIGERKEGGEVPHIGNNVSFGANCAVLGPVRVGDGARIGAMALVIDDVPAGGVALGSRATITAG